MQFRDLGKQYQTLKTDIDYAIQEVLDKSNFIGGTQVKELESQLAEYVGVKHCITCGNGTDALTMMMMAWDIKKGDAVFVPDFTFFASGEVVAFEGATPVFFDVCGDTYNADSCSLEEAVKAVISEGKLRPRAVIAVDLFGQPADYPKIRKVAEKYGLLVLEDGAQGFGGKIKSRRSCSFGNAGTTSFFPAKPLGCYGDGGAVFTDDDDTAAYLRSIAVHGKGSFKYDNVRIGWNSRLDTIQAAVLKVKLEAFQNHELEAVNTVADLYTELLKDDIIVPVIQPEFYSSWAQYTIQLKDREERDGLKEYLQTKGIPSMIYYPKPMHRQLAFKEERQYVECRVTERLCDTVLALPMHPYMTEEQIILVSDSVKSYIKRER